MSETLRDPVLASLFNQYALKFVDMKLQSVQITVIVCYAL